jgi:hypothetical protein
MLDEDTCNLRTQIWFENAGFTLPAESWTEEGECVVDDVLPSPDNGPGFGWGGGIYEGGGGGGSTEKHASVLLVSDSSTFNYYSQMTLWADALEELGLEEDTSGDIGDDMYYVFNNYSSSYSTYFISEDLLSNANAIFWTPVTSYYGYFLGSSTERDLIVEWAENTDGAFVAFCPYYFASYYMCSYSGAPNYAPTFMNEFMGLQSGDSTGYGYASGIFTANPIADTFYEPMGNLQMHYYTSTSGYNYMNMTVPNTGNGGHAVLKYQDGGRNCAFARIDEDNDYVAVWDINMPSQFSGGQTEYLLTRTQVWLEENGFTLP